MSLTQASRLGSLRTRSQSVQISEPWESSIGFVRAFEEECRRGIAPPLFQYWAEHGRDEPLAVLSALAKAELRARFERGETPTVADYIALFPQLRDDGDRVVSLVYEEYCLLEERGEQPSPESFCDRYGSWRDSLASQLQYHRNFSLVIAPPARPTFPETGTWFADAFHLRALLGAGGAGRVYLAEQPEFHRQVALKVTPETGLDVEPSIQGRLDHDHIVPVWSVVRDPDRGLRGLCMPYRPGLPLDEVVRRLDPKSRPRRALSLLATVLPTANERGATLPKGWRGFPVRGSYARAVAWVGATVARALAHAHDHNVFHRDVKPANILLTAREGPQLLDFNLAHAQNASEHAAAARSGGTLPYMAPEQLRAFLDPDRWADVGAAADVFALGLVLRELLTGDRPEAPDRGLPLPRAVQEMLDHRALPAPSLRALNPDIPHALAAIVDRCLAFDPSDRYPDAAALAEDLQRLITFRAPRHIRNPSRCEAAGQWLRRHRIKLLTAAALGLMVAIAAVGRHRILTQSKQRHDHEYEAIRQVGWGQTFLKEKRWNLARAAFERARSHNPRLFTALHGLGSVASFAGNFAVADRLFTEAIAATARTSPAVPPAKVADLYMDRARGRYHWGRSLQKEAGALKASGCDEDRLAALFAESEAHLQAVLQDIEQARRLKSQALGNGPITTRTELDRVALENIAASALVGLADVASHRGEIDTRLARYRTAWRHLAAALQIMPGDRATLEMSQAVLSAIRKILPDDAQIENQLRDVESRLQATKSLASQGSALPALPVPVRAN